MERIDQINYFDVRKYVQKERKKDVVRKSHIFTKFNQIFTKVNWYINSAQGNNTEACA